MTGARVVLQLCCPFFLAFTVAANADNTPSSADLARCAALSASDARLACYDALSNRPASAAATPAPVAPAQASSPATITPARTVPAAAPAANSGSANEFGLSPTQRHVADLGPKQERGQIISFSTDSPGHAIIVLDTGQTWAVTDDDGWLSKGDKVVIKRAALGSFLLMAPSHRTYRVRRLQ